ncbi:MAG: UvrD-helicase domain-containing protein, partial [bacterium]|nr:UvrD-helicase domain-containing protein [bacterium]
QQLLDQIQMITKDVLRILPWIDTLKSNSAIAFIEKWHTQIKWWNTCTSLESIVDTTQGFSPPFIRFRAQDEDLKQSYLLHYEPIKSETKALLLTISSLFLVSEVVTTQLLQESIPTTRVLIHLAKEFLLQWPSVMKQCKLYHFSDIFQSALYLLQSQPSIVEKYKSSIVEIMVDEYQDTNDFQELFLSYLAQENLFLVGDVKQSIYGFRNANPQNFIKKAKEYATNQSGKLIILPDNFRSRSEVLSGINQLFGYFMDEEIGGANYYNQHALEYGNRLYDMKSPRPQSNGLICLAYEVPDDNYQSIAQLEASLIAQDIIKKMNESHQILDLDTKQYRDVSFRDFAILVDRKTSFMEYQRSLIDAGIPVFVLGDESFTAAAEIQTATNAMILLQCFLLESFEDAYFKRAFYGFARSFVMQIKDELIIELFLDYTFTCKKDLVILKENPAFNSLFEIFEAVALNATYQPVDELLSEIYKRFDFFTNISSLHDPKSAEEKLQFLLQKIANFYEMDLFDTIAYLEKVQSSNELDIEYVKPKIENQDVVLILSMHKSKGLEFPICYYPGLSKRFNNPDSKSFFQFDPEFGLLHKVYDSGFHETPTHDLLKKSRLKKDISERIRLFYVALTRAKEQAILLLDKKFLQIDKTIQLNEFGTILSKQRLSIRCFADVLSYFPLLDRYTIDADSTVARLSKTIHQPMYEPSDAVFTKRQILPLEIESFTTPFVRQDYKAFFVLAYGKRLHQLLENFDFHHIQDSLSRIPTEAKPLFLTFLQQPFFASQILHFYQEMPFIDEFGQLGVIDLILETNEEYLVIDYKTSTIHQEQYLFQVTRYMNYIKSIVSKPVKGYLYSLLQGTYQEVGGQQ